MTAADPTRTPGLEQPDPTDEDRAALARLILDLRAYGVSDRRVLAVMEGIPRRLFLPAGHRDVAYADRALPIECGQTISQPAVVGQMTEALQLAPDSRVLEIGTGSGYQTAVLARLAGRVWSVERYRTLAALARDRLAALRIDNAEVIVGDGRLGLPDAAPFDRILITAAAPEVPEALRAQLAPGGILVAPIGPADGVQMLTRMVRTGAGFEETPLGAVRFVPLVPGVAERL